MAKGTVNKVTLIGRLGQDPEIRFSGDGKAIASVSYTHLRAHET